MRRKLTSEQRLEAKRLRAEGGARWQSRHMVVAIFATETGGRELDAISVAWDFDQFRRTICALSRMDHARR